MNRSDPSLAHPRGRYMITITPIRAISPPIRSNLGCPSSKVAFSILYRHSFSHYLISPAVGLDSFADASLLFKRLIDALGYDNIKQRPSFISFRNAER
jgi:hypothetical protein